MSRPLRSSFCRALPALFIAVVLGAPPLGATEVRVNTLGGAEKLLTLDDEASVKLLPTTLLAFPDRAFIDVMALQAPATSFGAHFALSPNAVIAVYGGSRSRPIAGGFVPSGVEPGLSLSSDGRVPDSDGLSSGDLIPGDLSSADLNAIFVAAHRFDGWRAGLLVGAWADVGQRDAQQTRRATFVETRLGAGVDLGAHSDLDFALVGGFATFRDERLDASEGAKTTRYEPDGLWQIGMVSRARLDIFGGGTLIPYGSLQYRDDKVIAHDGSEQHDTSSRGWLGAFGVDLALCPTDGVLIQPTLGFSVRFENGTDTARDRSIHSRALLLPTYGVAVEAWVLDWLALRFSARQTVRFQRQTTRVGGVESTTDHSAVDTAISLGLAFRFVGFSIDLLLNPELLNRGPYGLTGDETSSMNLQVAVSYAWGD